MKKISILSLILCIGIIGFLIIDNNKLPKFGSSFMDNKITLLGSSANYIRLPYYYYEAVSTTTAGFTDGGLLTQQISTNGLDNVSLAISAIGSVSTSTIYIKPMVSFDGTNFFNIATSTNSLMGTTTANITNSYIREFIPSAATSTKVFNFPEIKGSKYTRFLIYSPKAGELNTTTKAWIEAIKFEGISR